MKPLKIPDYRTLKFRLNTTTNYYEKTPENAPFAKIPPELKVEPTAEEKIKRNGAKEIIHGRIRDGRYLFFTGIISTRHAGLFHGNHYENDNGKKYLSLVLFQFTPDRSGLTVYFFNRFDVYPKLKQAFINHFVECKKANPGARLSLKIRLMTNQTTQRY